MTIVVPAYNEQEVIVDAVTSFLQMDFEEYEVIVVNDGSRDETLARLVAAFDLVPVNTQVYMRYSCAAIRQVYFSPLHPKLVVVDKVNGGKADAQNAGANLSRYPFVAGVDADSLLSKDSMKKLMHTFLTMPDTVAVGGIVRLSNGCVLRNGDVAEVHMPKKMLERIQAVEYLRAFLFGRMGWSQLNILLIISGAFAVFRQDVLREVGGWDKDSIGEDMEVVMRMHRLNHEKHRNQRIAFAPDPVCWTQAPDALRDLSTQRDRWQRGLMQTLLKNMNMFCNPAYKQVGMVGFPYFFIFEMLGCVIEFLAYPLLVIFWLLGMINVSFFLLFLTLAILFGLFISFTAIALEESTYRRYTGRGDVLKLFAAAVIENFGYRQLHAWWRFRGFCRYLTNTKAGWGSIRRQAMTKGSVKL